MFLSISQYEKPKLSFFKIQYIFLAPVLKKKLALNSLKIKINLKKKHLLLYKTKNKFINLIEIHFNMQQSTILYQTTI